MGRHALAACALSLALLFGCALSGGGNPGGSAQLQMEPQQGGVALKKSNTTYTAHYRVFEEGEEIDKAVYRMGQRMRIDIGSGLYGKVSLYFDDGKAFSCTAGSQGGNCFDVTARMAKVQPQFGFQDGPPADAAFEGKTEIGGTQGECYLAQNGYLGQRRLCYAKGGVLAYDEYNVSGNSTHVEYAVRISYAASESDFSLPYAPSKAPS